MHSATDLNNIISFAHVSKVFESGGEVALRDVSFSVARGELVCLLGPSGCGKSTLLRIVAGIEDPTSGRVIRPQHVAMVFQAGALLPWLTALDNVAFGIRAAGASENAAYQVSMKYIELLGMGEFVSRYPRELSGGQRQRVGIARALAVDPEVLLLDEPFSALDAKTTDDLHKDILKIWTETGKTILMISHLIEEAVALAQRVILMKEFAIDSVFDISLPRPRREHGAEFLKTVQEIRRKFFV